MIPVQVQGEVLVEDKAFKVGDGARWAPAGWRVYIDNSFGGSDSNNLAVRAEDILEFHNGSAECMSLVKIRAGAKVVRGRKVYELSVAQKLPTNGGLGLSHEEREEVKVTVL